MKYKIVICLLMLLVSGLSTAYAANALRIGTAGAQELRIPIGSRGTAMGGAVVANATGVESIFWNPAGLANMAGSEALFTHLPYLADIDVNFVGVATNIEGFGTLAAAAKVVSIGDMEETTDAAPDGTGRIFSPTMSVLSVTYSRIMTYRVQLGVTAKIIHERVFEASASGVAFDIGFMYQPGWRGLSLGLAIKNYGPEMRFSGAGFERSLGDRQASPKAAGFDLPSSFDAGVAYDLMESETGIATVTANFSSNNYSQDMWQGGAEYTYKERYSLRAGYNFADQDRWLYGFSAGGGLIYDIGNSKLCFEYSWTETETFSDNQYFTVKFQF
jgi:hypothetical protein